MFYYAMLIINFCFAVVSGAVLSAVLGSDWWFVTFLVGFVLWNVVASAIVLFVGFVGFVFISQVEGGK